MEGNKDRQLYIGIDLNASRAVISFYRADLTEPKEAASVADSNRQEFPLAVLRMNNGKYYYGEEALHFRPEAEGEAVFRDNLFAIALLDPQAPEKEDLFRLIRRLLYFRKHYEKDRTIPYDLTITVPEISSEVVSLMEELRKNLEIDREHFRITDYRESFFDYISMQDRSIWKQDTCLFVLTKDHLTTMRAHRSVSGADRVMEVAQERIPFSADVYDDDKALDQFMAEQIKAALNGNTVSGVYLIGERFEGDWRHAVMEAIGTNKRIFIGNHIFSRGACYGACRMRTVARPQVRYECEYRIRSKRFLRVLDQQKTDYIPLVMPRANWFESFVSYRLLYNGTQHFEIWDDDSNNTQEPCAILDLSDFPKRPEKGMYLDVIAYPLSEKSLCIEITDGGFGSFYESSMKTWHFEIDL